MTYCVGVRVDAGLVFLSDSRTNAGVDQISTFRKMHVLERPGERVFVVLTSGNLAFTQAIASLLRLGFRSDAVGATLWNARSMFDAATIAGEAVRAVYAHDAKAVSAFNIEFNTNLILGGQIRGEEPRLFHIYPAGNFIEATCETPFFQLGESKYGKPILDRVLQRGMSLEQTAKCALVSMDSTIKSNLSVGLPLDLVCYARDTLRVRHQADIDESDPYFSMIRTRWGEQLKKVFDELPDPPWWDRG